MSRLERGLIVGGGSHLSPAIPMNWVEASTGPGKALGAMLSASFTPFDSRPAALANFLDCSGPADYAGFAAHHGLLGLPNITASDSGTESVAIWNDAHRVLSAAFRLWKGSVDALESSPATDGISVRLMLEFAELRLGGQKALLIEQRFMMAGRPTDTDLLNCARATSTCLVNTILSEHAAPIALLSPGRAVAAMRIEGLNLFGSMAGELLQVMTGVRRVAVCPGCGRINDLTDQPRHRVYCPGDSYARCRKAASRSGTTVRGRVR